MRNYILISSLIFSLLSFLLYGCNSKEAINSKDLSVQKRIPKDTNFRVNYYTQECQGVDVMTCLLIQDDELIGTTDWNLFYNQIEGFNYVPGYIYNLKVKVSQIENPLQDSSSLKYELEKILSKEKVDL